MNKLLAVSIMATVLTFAACGKDMEFSSVHGSVTVDGKPIDMGSVRFVPIEGSKGPPSLGTISAGQYRVEARGGVPVGKHRVEVVARGKSGRKVPQKDLAGKTVMVDGKPAMMDEIVELGPEEYGGSNSPLTFEVKPGGNGRFDIDIPAERQ